MSRVSAKWDDDAVLSRLGAAVRVARQGRGQSQEALADAAGIDRSHMGKIERGERNVSILNVARIATALGVLPSALLSAADL
ncbi:helix-turn-helix domain-containing protein [Sphingomonas sp. S1-29]|nr:helix-turn-helix domain-containing protein [Sphingomonas sp. S1-29]